MKTKFVQLKTAVLFDFSFMPQKFELYSFVIQLHRSFG